MTDRFVVAVSESRKDSAPRKPLHEVFIMENQSIEGAHLRSSAVLARLEI